MAARKQSITVGPGPARSPAGPARPRIPARAPAPPPLPRLQLPCQHSEQCALPQPLGPRMAQRCGPRTEKVSSRKRGSTASRQCVRHPVHVQHPARCVVEPGGGQLLPPPPPPSYLLPCSSPSRILDPGPGGLQPLPAVGPPAAPPAPPGAGAVASPLSFRAQQDLRHVSTCGGPGGTGPCAASCRSCLGERTIRLVFRSSFRACYNPASAADGLHRTALLGRLSKLPPYTRSPQTRQIHDPVHPVQQRPVVGHQQERPRPLPTQAYSASRPAGPGDCVGCPDHQIRPVQEKVPRERPGVRSPPLIDPVWAIQREVPQAETGQGGLGPLPGGPQRPYHPDGSRMDQRLPASIRARARQGGGDPQGVGQGGGSPRQGRGARRRPFTRTVPPGAGCHAHQGESTPPRALGLLPTPAAGWGQERAPRPFRTTWPEVGWILPTRMWSRVLFPIPLGTHQGGGPRDPGPGSGRVGGTRPSGRAKPDLLGDEKGVDLEQACADLLAAIVGVTGFAGEIAHRYPPEGGGRR